MENNKECSNPDCHCENCTCDPCECTADNPFKYTTAK